MYRRGLRWLEPFEVRTQIVEWDERSFFFEHRITGKNGLCAVAFIECRLLNLPREKNLADVARDLGFEIPARSAQRHPLRELSQPVVKTLLQKS